MRYRRTRVCGATYFFTLVTHERTRLFSDTRVVDAWYEATAKIRATRPFTTDAEVILPDHIHTMWELPDGDDDYPTRIRLVKSAFTRAMRRVADHPVLSASRKRKGEREVWQRRYWEHLIRDEADFEAHLDYIHSNPVKHGLVAKPIDWPHSTFRHWVEKGRYDPWWTIDAMPPMPEWFGGE